jgi:acetaldehyde dehydrogenase
MNGKNVRSETGTHPKKHTIRAAIIGTGNIGSDLLAKIQRSEWLTTALFAGKNADSPGIARARAMGITVSSGSIDAVVEMADKIDIVFDATSAEYHRIHAPILKRLKKFVIDMTPSKIGVMCVPDVNLQEGLAAVNVNMISCGGQANVPLISAIRKVHPDIPYVEVVSSISSKSAGIGTRNNIDEYTQTTSDAIVKLTGVPQAKTIIILNPADPPILMHNTIYVPIDRPDLVRLTAEIHSAVDKIKQYVPGFKLILGPILDHGRLTVMSEVVGLGDFLPVFAGNLDIINCAAIAVAEEYARLKMKDERVDYARD